jgi:DNA polymerase II large subunit
MVSDPVVSVEHVPSPGEWLYDLEVEEYHNYLVDDLTLTSNCDGDEDAVFLLMDGLLNFSREYVPDRRGGLMDLPLVLTTRIDPSEIDKEAHNLDVLSSYPLGFYEATMRHAHPREVEGIMGLVAGRVGTPAQYEGFGYTHDTPDISQGTLVSAYKTIGDMMTKLEAQLGLASKIRAVDLKDVASRVIGTHFMPDLIGNLKAFSKQKVRCPACNTKYRRMPVAGRCLTKDCKGKITLTVHEGSVRKYLQPALEISRKYEISAYTLQRIVLAEKSIESLFNNDKVRKAKLSDFLAG